MRRTSEVHHQTMLSMALNNVCGKHRAKSVCEYSVRKFDIYRVSVKKQHLNIKRNLKSRRKNIAYIESINW